MSNGTDQLSAAQAAVAQSLRATPQPARFTRTLTFLLEDLVPVPGTRFRVGLDPVLTLVPWAGSAVGAAFGAALVVDAVRLRMPVPVLLRMFANWLIDWALGAVPYLGPFFDVAWRSNSKNLRLLHRTIEDRGEVRRATLWYWLVALSIPVLMFAMIVLLPAALLLWFVTAN